jgi:hypothetical protein
MVSVLGLTFRNLEVYRGNTVSFKELFLVEPAEPALGMYG